MKFRTVHARRADRIYGKVDIIYIVDIVNVIDIVDIVDVYHLLTHYLLRRYSITNRVTSEQIGTLLSILKMVYPLHLPLTSLPRSVISVPQ